MDLRRYQRGQSPFDSTREPDDEGNEWWSARELMPMLGYPRWPDARPVLDRAKVACRKNGQSIAENFRDAPKVFTHPTDRKQVVANAHMTRQALSQNGLLRGWSVDNSL